MSIASRANPKPVAHHQQLFARTRLTIKPVIDLSDRVRTTAYEHPESLKERIHLTTGGDYWPYATATSRRLDHDHPIPYADPGDGGPPGQTGTHNSGPLGGDITDGRPTPATGLASPARGATPGAPPHGLGFLVDHTGTRRIDPHHARMIIEAPPGVDIYPSHDHVELALRSALL